MPRQQKGTSRAEKVKRRRTRKLKRLGASSRPVSKKAKQRPVSRNALFKSMPPKVFGKKPSRLSRAILSVGFSIALALGPTGCGPTTTKLGNSLPLSYSKLRDVAEISAQKAASKVTGTVPGGGSFGKDIASEALKLALGPNPAKEIREMKSSCRLKYSDSGPPVSSRFWYDCIGLNPGNPRDKHRIYLVDNIANKVTISPEGVMFIIGANARSGTANLEKKMAVQKDFLKKISERISLLEQGSSSFITKLGKREAILKQLEDHYSARNRVAFEFLVLEKMFEIRKTDPESFNSLMELGRNRLHPKICRNIINSIPDVFKAK